MTVEDVKELAHIESTIKHRKEDVKLKCNFEFQRKMKSKKLADREPGAWQRRTLRTMSKWQQHKINLPNSIKQLKLPKKGFAHSLLAGARASLIARHLRQLKLNNEIAIRRNFFQSRSSKLFLSFALTINRRKDIFGRTKQFFWMAAAKKEGKNLERKPVRRKETPGENKMKENQSFLRFQVHLDERKREKEWWDF